MTFKSTEEQEEIFRSILHDDCNLLIRAYAGCGKSTTMLLAIKKLIEFYGDVKKTISIIAFNKHIRDEMKSKLPEGVNCSTLHGIGYGGITRKYKDIKMDIFKVDNHIKKKLTHWQLDSEFKKEGEKERYIKAIKEMVDLCRSTLTTDRSFVLKLADKYDIKPIKTLGDAKRVLQVLESMTNDIKTFDYVDMIYMPAVDNKIFLFPSDFLITEEIQDLNRAQQKMIEKMCKRDKVTKKITTKLISVGDKKQAIYAFTGVGEKSFDWFKEFPNTKELPLSHSFRCAKNIILEANKIVPEIKALSNAASGIVRSGNVLSEAQSGDFVLCRTTAPLVKLFFYYISQSRTATIVGTEIGTNLIDMLGSFINVNDLLIYWMNRLEILRDSLKSMGVLDVYEDNAYQSLDDKVTTLAFIAKYCKSTVDLKEKILKIFTDDKDNRGIILSTIHKSKGLEADRVFIVRTDLLPLKAAMSRPWLLEQEYNLKYVAITRARNELIYDYEWNDDVKEKNN